MFVLYILAQICLAADDKCQGKFNDIGDMIIRPEKFQTEKDCEDLGVEVAKRLIDKMGYSRVTIKCTNLSGVTQ